MKSHDFLRIARIERLSNVAFLPDGQLPECGAISPLLSAMLNGDGGALVLGARPPDNNDDIDVTGLLSEDGVLRGFEQQIQDSISPGAPVFVQSCEVDGKTIIVVDVPPGKDPPYAGGSIIYALHDGAPVPATNAEIREWVLSSSAETNRWENRAAFANALDAIERPSIERAVREAQESKRKILDVHADTTRLLSEFQVMRYDRLLNAGLVLFGRGVGRWLPQAQVRFVHFAGKTTDSDVLYSDLYDGPICDTINTIRDYIVEHALQVQVFDSTTGNRYQTVAYPVMPVREALVNAFAHRDYESALGGIMVRMFGDRVEISNTGTLPEGVKVSDLNAGRGAPSRLVNPLIANNLYFRGYMEHVGRGSAFIRNECLKVGTKVSWSLKTPGMVTVTLTANAVSKFNDESINQSLKLNNDSPLNIVQIQENALSDPELTKFVDVLVEHPFARRPGLQEITGMSRGEVQGLLNKLKSAHLLTYVGSKKTGGYYIVRIKDIDFDYKMIVRHCFEAEHKPDHSVHGGYQPEKVRKLLAKLKREGLIYCEEADTETGSSHHYDFLGFTDAGRELFLENGQIKNVYRV